MNLVSSIRWSNEKLYHQVKEFAELHDENINSLMLKAIQEYIRSHHSSDSPSELRRQTAAYAKQQEDFDMTAWTSGYDTRDWDE